MPTIEHRTLNINGKKIKVPFVLDLDYNIDNFLFISSGEYLIYDEAAYNYMESDKKIEQFYEQALKKHCANKRVLDIGTGAYMDWAALAVEVGQAKEAVGVEITEQGYGLAQNFLRQSPFASQLTLQHSSSFDFSSDELFDVIVSEVIGGIASSEGVINTLVDARQRLMNPDGVMIPYRCKTHMAGVCLADYLKPSTFGFHPDAEDYLVRVFETHGLFDVRLAMVANDPKMLMTDTATVEDLNFQTGNYSPDRMDCVLTANRDCRIDGLLLWIELTVREDDEDTIDSLRNNTAWECIYIPIFDEPVALKKGETLDAMFQRIGSDTGFCSPDYQFSLAIPGQPKASFHSPYKPTNSSHFHTKSIYQKLFQV